MEQENNSNNGHPSDEKLMRTIINYGNIQYVVNANIVNFNKDVDSSAVNGGQSLMAYISDPQRREEIARALATVKDLKTLCRSVLFDIYCGELNDLKDKDKIIVSHSFIQSFTPPHDDRLRRLARRQEHPLSHPQVHPRHQRAHSPTPMNLILVISGVTQISQIYTEIKICVNLRNLRD